MKETSSVDDPSGKLHAKKLGPYVVKKVWSNIAQLDEHEIGNIVSIDQLSIATRGEEFMTHGGSDDYTTDIADNKMTIVDSIEASRNKADGYVVNKIVAYDVVRGEKLYRVR